MKSNTAVNMMQRMLLLIRTAFLRVRLLAHSNDMSISLKSFAPIVLALRARRAEPACHDGSSANPVLAAKVKRVFSCFGRAGSGDRARRDKGTNVCRTQLRTW
jgi:hypothetical protein